jgi:O-6-methylguanine DNA methyltransferase
MENLSVIYFKAKQIDVYILISFNHLIKNQKVVLNEIKFFNDEDKLLSYVKQEELIGYDEENDFNAIKELKNLINNYLSGNNINLFTKSRNLKIDLAIDKKFPTEFSKKVIKYLIDNVKFAQNTSYSEIGERIGSKAYRAIGNILKNNPLPLIIPCHRVIRKNGDIGGFMGKIDDNWQKNLKKQLLSIENHQKIL